METVSSIKMLAIAVWENILSILASAQKNLSTIQKLVLCVSSQPFTSCIITNYHKTRHLSPTLLNMVSNWGIEGYMLLLIALTVLGKSSCLKDRMTGFLLTALSLNLWTEISCFTVYGMVRIGGATHVVVVIQNACMPLANPTLKPGGAPIGTIPLTVPSRSSSRNYSVMHDQQTWTVLPCSMSPTLNVALS